MAWKCLDCGHIFEDGEQRIDKEYHGEVEGGFCEEFESCPICGGDFEETKQCKECGGEFLEDELFGGYYCKECLEETITVDTFFAFATDGISDYSPEIISTLEDFVFVELFKVETPKHGSRELKEYCEERYHREAALNKLLGKDELYKRVIDYFNKISTLRDEFAEWLERERW